MGMIGIIWIFVKYSSIDWLIQKFGYFELFP
jgi:hypothetical protein